MTMTRARFGRRRNDRRTVRKREDSWALAAIYDGATRTEAAKIGGVGLQVVRDWVMKFNADGPEGLIDRKAPGQPPRLNDGHRAALAAILDSGPIPAVHGWCAGGLLISANRFSRNFVSSSPSRLSEPDSKAYARARRLMANWM